MESRATRSGEFTVNGVLMSPHPDSRSTGTLVHLASYHYCGSILYRLVYCTFTAQYEVITPWKERVIISLAKIRLKRLCGLFPRMVVLGDAWRR